MQNNKLKEKLLISQFPAVSKTALVPLYCKAIDYQAKRPILKDKFSFDLYQRIEFDWNIVKKSIRSSDPVLMAVRVRKFDEMCRQFLDRSPDGIIVNMGSGLDNRFGRIDNNQCYFVDLDFPEVIAFKKSITQFSTRNAMIGKSVLDFSWIKQISELRMTHHAPVFFIAEGVMIYLDIQEMQELFINIRRIFPQSEIFFDLFSERGKNLAASKTMFKDLNVRIKTGLNSSRLIEDWDVGFRVISEWYFSEDPDAKRGWMRYVWMIPGVEKLQYFVHGKFM